MKVLRSGVALDDHDAIVAIAQKVHVKLEVAPERRQSFFGRR